MADIFISYASADREKVRPFAEALEKTGWQVWWDRQIRSGAAFDRIIEQALDEAQCVIVIWSHSSVESDWVRAEAGDGLERGILISISIEQELRVPLRFRNVHTDLIINLAVDQAPSVFKKILGDIRKLIGGPKPESVTTKAETNQKAESIEPTEQEISKPAEKFKNSIGMEFVLIPADNFRMGSKLMVREAAKKYGGNAKDYISEHPQHNVTISEPFYLQATAVTQGQWVRVMEDNPSEFKNCGDDCPVESVSWEDARKFIKELIEMEQSDAYRLPTEAEWEYACRAGTTTEFSFGDNLSELMEYAWLGNNSDGKTHPVGQKEPNAWGLYDMHGNVWEWVEDDWHKDYNGAHDDGRAWIDEPRGGFRVVRGGGWGGGARYCRSAYRNGREPDGRGIRLGFRLARSVALDS